MEQVKSADCEMEICGKKIKKEKIIYGAVPIDLE